MFICPRVLFANTWCRLRAALPEPIISVLLATIGSIGKGAVARADGAVSAGHESAVVIKSAVLLDTAIKRVVGFRPYRP